MKNVTEPVWRIPTDKYLGVLFGAKIYLWETKIRKRAIKNIY